MVSDLHMHSTASDGELTPEQVVKRAKDRGIEWMALSDHDTAAGVEQAVLLFPNRLVNVDVAGMDTLALTKELMWAAADVA